MTTLTPYQTNGLTRADAQRIGEAVSAAISANTARAYRSQWAQWAAWAAARRCPLLPAAPEHVAAYLTERAEGGAKPASLRASAAALAFAHRAADLPSPTEAAGVRTVLRGLSRVHAAPQAQAAALTDDALASIRQTAERPRAGETQEAARRRGLVDVALVQLLADTGLRRSEASALTWADVEHWPDGSGRVHVRQSKTDQTAEGAIVYASPLAMRDLDAMRAAALPPQEAAPVFASRRGGALSPSQIARRIGQAAEAAGLGTGYGGHSGRVGMARRMTQRGAPAAAVMRQGRWRSPAMVARYTRAEAAGEAGRYLS